jgi:hypothetical protein
MLRIRLQTFAALPFFMGILGCQMFRKKLAFNVFINFFTLN